MSDTTDISLLRIGEELLPGYIQRALDSGLITADEAAAARAIETDALAELMQLSERHFEAKGELTLDEAFIVAAIKESD